MSSSSSHENHRGGIIAPCLWFDDQAREAADFYVGLFPSSRVTGESRYPKGFENPANKPAGSLMTVEFELSGHPFTALNGGPDFQINPTISLFAFTPGVDAAERLARALADGGQYLMELGEYPWSPRYAWVRDRFGVSWQVMSTGEREAYEIAPCLMFAGRVHGRAEEALELYTSVFPGARIESLERYGPEEGPEGTLKHGRATLGVQTLVAMDSHLEHNAEFNEGLSLQILCRDQAEVDHYWNGFVESGGEEGPCGWLKDRFGVSWQVVPIALVEMLTSEHASEPGYENAFRAMLDMTKLDIRALEAAAERSVMPG